MDQYYTVKEYPLESTAGGQSVYAVAAPGDVHVTPYFRVREHAEDMAWILNWARRVRTDSLRHANPTVPLQEVS